MESWGRLDFGLQSSILLSDPFEAPRLLGANSPGLPFGKGRSYGDICLTNRANLWRTDALDHIIHFDAETGVLSCEAGVQLGQIQKLVVGSGWMLPVVPGTQFVTVGGAIANDVHGKNHHLMGCFGNHVLGLTLLRTDGIRVECGPDREPDWFGATVGGMGLTGLILSARLKLRRVVGPWIDTEKILFSKPTEFFELSEASSDWEYTVSWFDCVGRKAGRGVFIRGRHSASSRAPKKPSRGLQVPFVPIMPIFNRATLPVMNSVYFNAQKISGSSRETHYEEFFHPLDVIKYWNRLYGPSGFYQYQCVIPATCQAEAIIELLGRIASAKQGSFLAVLKTFGSLASPGWMSFPMAGTTLALDFANKGDATLKLFGSLDEVVAQVGGRIYPAKDARMPRALFEAGYPNLGRFLKFRDAGIRSGLSVRLMGH